MLRRSAASALALRRAVLQAAPAALKQSSASFAVRLNDSLCQRDAVAACLTRGFCASGGSSRPDEGDRSSDNPASTSGKGPASAPVVCTIFHSHFATTHVLSRVAAPVSTTPLRLPPPKTHRRADESASVACPPGLSRRVLRVRGVVGAQFAVSALERCPVTAAASGAVAGGSPSAIEVDFRPRAALLPLSAGEHVGAACEGGRRGEL